MNAARLLEYFDRIAEAPDAVSRLRKFILDLAVRGKLVEQDPNDEPASELLKKIQNQRAKLEKDGKLAKIKQCQPIDEEELPSGYSDCESFARLICVAYPCKGLTGIQSAKPGNFPLVVTAESRLACDHYDFDGSATLVPLVSSTGHGHASINRLHYQEGKFAVGSILCAIFPVEEKLLSARFIYEYLSAYKEELLVSKMIGTANVTLTMSKIAEIPIPITTPRSQARLHELMALCDRLEASQAKRESRRDRLASASLKRIGQHEDVDNGEEFREKVRFHLHHLPRLVTRSEHVKELRQTILNLAVRGMLVPQDPNDEPASELLKKVHAKKNKLLKDGLIRKTRAVLLDEEGESCIPRTWRWICIDQFFIVTGGIQKTPAREPQNNHYPCISVGNVYRNRFELDCVKRFELRDGELEKYAVISVRLRKGLTSESDN